MEKVIIFLQKYQLIPTIVMIVSFAVIIVTIFLELIKLLRKLLSEIKIEREKEELQNAQIDGKKINEKGAVIRRLVCADAIDPGPMGYLKLAYGSKEYYVRSFSISKLPNNTIFARTFSDLMNFPNCTSSFYVHPLSEATMSAKLDRHNTVLEAELAMTKNSNQKRRLAAKRAESERVASEIEAGNTKLFNVGALFTFYDESLEKLNQVSDLFCSAAKEADIIISNRYAMQSEAFLANAPMNYYMGRGAQQSGMAKITKPCAVDFNLMDKHSASTLYNYTQSSFSHKTGVYLGRDMFTSSPVIYNIFDNSHLSYIGALFGGMGSGKSATIKELVIRNRLFGYRYVAIDGQERKVYREGEYAALAKKIGGYNFMLSADSDNILNIFDVSESTVSYKTDIGTIEEKTVLELNKTKSFIVSILLRIIQGNRQFNDFTLYTYIRKIVTNLLTLLYDQYQIYDGKPSSLYKNISNESVDIGITSGYSKKKMPTLSDFYRLAITESIHNTDASLTNAYNLLLASLGDYVREIYYSVQTGKFFTASEYMNLPEKVINGKRSKYYTSAAGDELVAYARGTRVYFDGQSTVNVELKKCPFLNIDLSKLQEDEKPIARIVAMGFLNENVIKKNSEILNSSDKLLLIVDEFHEIIRDAINSGGTEGDGTSVLDTVENIVRTARKRNVGMLLCSQTVQEFMANATCEKIIGLLSFAFIFKQSIKDKDLIKNTFGLTDSQAGLIVDYIGGKGEDDATKKAHRGETCLVDIETKRVCYVKIDYFKQVEGEVVETDSAEIEKIINNQSA